jgi:hypothetical protein
MIGHSGKMRFDIVIDRDMVMRAGEILTVEFTLHESAFDIISVKKIKPDEVIYERKTDE